MGNLLLRFEGSLICKHSGSTLVLDFLFCLVIENISPVFLDITDFSHPDVTPKSWTSQGTPNSRGMLVSRTYRVGLGLIREICHVCPKSLSSKEDLTTYILLPSFTKPTRLLSVINVDLYDYRPRRLRTPFPPPVDRSCSSFHSDVGRTPRSREVPSAVWAGGVVNKGVRDGSRLTVKVVL